MAEYTLPFKYNQNLDYNFIREKCQKVMDNIIDFDPHTHQLDSKETKGLFYFFKYVKKNLFLFAAIDSLPGDYEDEIKYIFDKFH